MTGGSSIDGYVSAEALAEARSTVHVRDSETGVHLFRVVDDGRLIYGLAVAPRLAVAADLLDHAVEDGTVDGRVTSVVRALLAAVTSATERTTT